MLPGFDAEDWVEVPGGEYRMGQDDGRDEERPAHLVRIGAFLLCRHQVTNAEYDRFVAAHGRPASPHRARPELSRPDQPVVAVSWFDAAAYCAWLAAELGRPFRLPSEAEWERAARGGLEGRLYPWGDEPPEARPGYHERWRQGPEPVGSSPANGYGLFDMCENVHEWCADWYEAGWYAASPAADPRGPTSGTRRASRGGAWRHQVKIARCAARSSIPPASTYTDYGFRVACGALTPPPPGSSG
jgi:formylglycine-generating enzyme required for sulfatase activity